MKLKCKCGAVIPSYVYPSPFIDYLLFRGTISNAQKSILSLPQVFLKSSFRRNLERINELRHKSLTSAHYFSMVPKFTFHSNLVPKLIFGVEVHSLVPKLLLCRNYSCRTSIAPLKQCIRTVTYSFLFLRSELTTMLNFVTPGLAPSKK